MGAHSLLRREALDEPWWRIVGPGHTESSGHTVDFEMLNDWDNLVFFAGEGEETIPLHAKGICRCCGMTMCLVAPNGGHKMSCSYGSRYQSKVTAPVTMLQRYGPISDKDQYGV